MSIKLGLNCKLYRNTGTFASPTLNEISCVRDLTLSLSAGEADVSTRGSGGWKATKATLKDASVEFKLIPNKDVAGDLADIEAFTDAFYANPPEPIDLVVLDGPDPAPSGSVASHGLHAWFAITSLVRNENLEEGVTYDITLKPSIDGADATEEYTGTVTP